MAVWVHSRVLYATPITAYTMHTSTVDDLRAPVDVVEGGAGHRLRRGARALRRDRARFALVGGNAKEAD